MTHDAEFYADRVRLMRMERATAKHEEWLGNWPYTPAHWEFASDGTLIFDAEHHARTKLFAYAGHGEPRALTGDGSASSATPLAGGRVAFLQQTLIAPSEVFVMPASGGGSTRVTKFTDDGTALYHTGEVRETTFEGSRGENVQMFVVLPPDF